MSYVQGTVVECGCRVTDINGTDLVPDDVVFTIEAPDGTQTVSAFSEDEVALADGEYSVLADTSPAPGTWEYQVTVVDGSAAVVKRRQFRVVESL